MDSARVIAIHAVCAAIGIAGGIDCLQRDLTWAAWAAMGFAALNIAELGSAILRKC